MARSLSLSRSLILPLYFCLFPSFSISLLTVPICIAICFSLPLSVLSVSHSFFPHYLFTSVWLPLSLSLCKLFPNTLQSLTASLSLQPAFFNALLPICNVLDIRRREKEKNSLRENKYFFVYSNTHSKILNSIATRRFIKSTWSFLLIICLANNPLRTIVRK